MSLNSTWNKLTTSKAGISYMASLVAVVLGSMLAKNDNAVVRWSGVVLLAVGFYVLAMCAVGCDYAKMPSGMPKMDRMLALLAVLLVVGAVSYMAYTQPGADMYSAGGNMYVSLALALGLGLFVVAAFMGARSSMSRGLVVVGGAIIAVGAYLCYKARAEGRPPQLTNQLVMLAGVGAVGFSVLV